MSNSVEGISVDEAIELMNYDDSRLEELITRAGAVREQYCGNEVYTCAIVNAKSGNCEENCTFCPQSVHSSSDIDIYGLKNEEDVLDRAKTAKDEYAKNFGIVTSGRLLSNKDERETVKKTISAIAEETGIHACASLGVVEKEYLQELKDAGMSAYHHNLETARSHYHNVCTTRTYDENVQAVKDALDVGLAVCSGGIFGMGESNEQRVELLQTLREIGVKSIPINFLNPVEGTPIFGKHDDLTPEECLKIIAVARLMHPEAQIRVCGGRDRNLGEMQSRIFEAGANALMIGSYLTTSGRDVETDMQMIKDAGMTLAEDGLCGCGSCECK